MYFTELFIIMGFSVLIWIWLESMRINEIARSIGSKLCKKNNVQFLDESVYLSSVRLGKNSHNQITLLRKYKFEFTNSDLFRYNGEITLAGKQFHCSNMDAYRISEANYNQ